MLSKFSHCHWSADWEPSEAIVQLKQLMASVVGMKGEEMINTKDSINIMAILLMLLD